MDLFNEFATDAAAEQKGTRVPFKGVTFIVARSGNKAYSKALTEAVNKNQVVLDQKDAEADALSERLMGEVLAKTVLLGWEGPMKYQGADLPYSFENACKVLAHGDFRMQVVRWADDRNLYRVKEVEAKVGNS